MVDDCNLYIHKNTLYIYTYTLYILYNICIHNIYINTLDSKLKEPKQLVLETDVREERLRRKKKIQVMFPVSLRISVKSVMMTAEKALVILLLRNRISEPFGQRETSSSCPKQYHLWSQTELPDPAGA